MCAIQNNFFATAGSKGNIKWHTQSTQHVAVQYSVEAVRVDGNVTLPVVQISMLLINDPHIVRGCPKYNCDTYGRVYKVAVQQPVAGGPTVMGEKTEQWASRCDHNDGGCCRAAIRPGSLDATEVNPMWKQPGCTNTIDKYATCITIDATRSNQCAVPDEPSYQSWGDRPLGDPSTRVILPIGNTSPVPLLTSCTLAHLTLSRTCTALRSAVPYRK